MKHDEVEHGQGWHDARREHEAGHLNVNPTSKAF